MSKKAAEQGADFEKGMERLEKVARALESGKLSLEESVALYKEGMSLSRDCRALLDKARHEVEEMSAGPANRSDAAMHADNLEKG